MSRTRSSGRCKAGEVCFRAAEYGRPAPGGGRGFFVGFLSGNQLKVIACVSMFIDHLGMIFFPGVAALRIIGRLAMPLFAFTFAEGCFYSRRKWRRFLLILAIGICTSAGFSLAAGSPEGDIMITLSLSCLIIYALDALKRSAFAGERAKILLYTAALAAAVALAVAVCCFSPLRVDYGIAGVFLPVSVRLFDFRSFGARGVLASLYRPWLAFAPFLACLVILALVLRGVQVFALLAMIPILLYSGERGGHGLKYLFYVFYPAHLALLAGVYLALHPGFFTSLF